MVLSQINFKTYYILFHKPLNACIFCVIYSDYFKNWRKRETIIYTFFIRKPHIHTSIHPPSSNCIHDWLVLIVIRRSDYFLQLKKIEFWRNLEKNSIFADCRDRHGIGKYLIAHVKLTGFPRDSHATRDKITLDLILSRDACIDLRLTHASCLL